jgi:hypothetical protein
MHPRPRAVFFGLSPRRRRQRGRRAPADRDRSDGMPSAATMGLVYVAGEQYGPFGGPMAYDQVSGAIGVLQSASGLSWGRCTCARSHLVSDSSFCMLLSDQWQGARWTWPPVALDGCDLRAVPAWGRPGRPRRLQRRRRTPGTRVTSSQASAKEARTLPPATRTALTSAGAGNGRSANARPINGMPWSRKAP